MQLLFNITLSFRAIRNNRVRSVLTIAIIGLGIMALVGILTAIEVMKESIYSNFSSMGANTLQINSDVMRRKMRKKGIYINNNITYDEARMFKDRFHFPGTTVSLTVRGSDVSTVHYRSEKTNPNVNVNGVDESHLQVTDTKLTEGRNFSVAEINSGSYVCLLGSKVADKLFKNKLAAGINQVISVGDVKYRVIGIMEAKGGSMMGDADNVVLVPLNTARSIYGGAKSYLISVYVSNVQQKDLAAEEAEGLFRAVRRLPLGVQSNFTITQNSDMVSMVLDSIKYVRWAAIVIGIITLLGSVIGLMNIMLVSVAERTREIGVSKALGARSSTIKRQFLTESVMISLMGGAVGVVLGMLAGNTVSLVFHTGFVVPWLWITVGVSLCAFVGVISGIYPAIKASRLDPIVALRYE